ncbi:MAG: CPXCG motif-containing cysteine-rich protein, partial [Caldithrix sp.]|nr:CPXCG motif-containing cysteine-rich protein [Caldithrix sp.]
MYEEDCEVCCQPIVFD